MPGTPLKSFVSMLFTFPNFLCINEYVCVIFAQGLVSISYERILVNVKLKS